MFKSEGPARKSLQARKYEKCGKLKVLGFQLSTCEKRREIYVPYRVICFRNVISQSDSSFYFLIIVSF